MDIISYSLASEAETKAKNAQAAANDALSKALTIKQVTKLGVIGTSSAPHVTDIVLNNTTIEYIKPAPSVLKIVNDMGTTGGTENVIKVASAFSNGEASDFNENSVHVIFDGQMKLNTYHSSNFTQDATYTGSGALYKAPLERATLTDIKKVEVL